MGRINKQRPDTAAITFLANFLDQYPGTITPEDLRNPTFTSVFFPAMYEHALRAWYADGKGSAIETFVIKWRGMVTFFLTSLVFPTGLIAEPKEGIPRPRAVRGPPERKSLRVNAEGEHQVRLLTNIPLQITDEEAIRLIFVEIKKSLQHTAAWADYEISTLEERLIRREELAKQGGIRQVFPGQQRVGFPTSWGSKNNLENGAASFKHYGYLTEKDSPDIKLLYPPPRTSWCEVLAIPLAATFLPHCAILILEHPAITPSFLENFELYDKNGKLAGIIPSDGGPIAVGVKLRRGPALAVQDIFLSEKASLAFDQIVRLTKPLRDYLRSRNNDDWRYLLITGGRTMAYPKRQKRLATYTSAAEALKLLAIRFQKALGWSSAEASDFARRFSLSSLRATTGVAVYLETRSVQKMSEALGHASYRPDLLIRYLPPMILDFFQDRWIRIFQLGIIVEAMKDSSYLLPASGFDSMKVLDEFLGKHALKFPQSYEANPNADPWSIGDHRATKEVVFGLNEEVLTLMLSLELAAKDSKKTLKPKAAYWAAMTTALVPYVNSAACDRDDIKAFLFQARLNASATRVEGFAYEQ